MRSPGNFGIAAASLATVAAVVALLIPTTNAIAQAQASDSSKPTYVLRVASSEGPFEAYVARPTGPGRPAIVVLHEVFGVNADLRSTCDELASAALASNPHCELFSYPDCHHAFSRHGGMHFDADAARKSRARTLAFFNRSLA